MKVSALSLTPVKGTRLQRVDAVTLTHGGARGDRRFFVIDERDRMVNAKQLGQLQSVVASYDGERLALRFPLGATVEGPVSLGEVVRARFFSRVLEGRVLQGPWSEVLSAHVGQPLRLVEPASGAVDRGARGAASLISTASLERLATEADASVDSRRFRMLIEIDGVDAHEEDGWVRRRTSIGAAVIRWGGHVGRCLITSRDPDSGEVDLPTLDILSSYRGNGHVESTEPLPLGIYGAVLKPGAVAVGDPVSLLD